VTLAPREIVSQDLSTLRDGGLTDRDILDATYICAGFNVIARIADALGFDIPSDDRFSKTARLLVIFGYKRLSGFWTSGVYNRSDDLIRTVVSEITRRPTFDPYERKVSRLRNAVLSGPGSLSSAIRQTIYENREQSGVLGAYARKVVEHAYLVTDDDIAELHQAGYTDDEIFEATVSAALGAGLLRIESVLRALRSTEPANIVSPDATLRESCPHSLPQEAAADSI